MQRKKLKKTNEINKNNLWTRMLLCFLVSITLIGVGTLLPQADAQPPSPKGFLGFVYDCGGAPLDGVLVTGTNLATSTTITAVTGGGVGVYILEFNVTNNPVGSTVHITYEGQGQLAGWFAEQDVITTTAPHPQPIPDVYLCWYYKPAGDTSPSGMPDFGPQGQFSDAAAAVANCLWWYDNNRPEYDGLVPIEDPIVLMTDLDSYIGPDYSAANVQAAIDAYLLNYLGTSTGILYTTLYSPPDYLDDIEEELLISQDVLLHLLVYNEFGEPMEALWVTAAGVCPSNWTLAISDPYLDNAEAGGPGRVPVAHPIHTPGDPTHNDPSLVSHDWYPVDISIHPGYYALYEYGYPGWYADITDVITVCPYIIEDLEITKAVCNSAGCCNYTICVDDTYGDTWNGGILNVYVNGVPVYMGLAADDYASYVWQCYDLPVCNGDEIFMDYTYGSYPSENVWELRDCTGAVVYSQTGGYSDTSYDGSVIVSGAPPVGWDVYAEINIGETATFNITVCNTGNSPLEDVNIYDVIPTGLEYVPGSATITPTTASSNYLAWEGLWPILDPGVCIYIEFDVIATGCCSDLINEAEVAAFAPVSYVDILKTDTAMVHPYPIPNMEVTKEIWDPDAGVWADFAEIRLGENAQFRISIYNDPTTNPCCSLDVYVDDYVAYGGPQLEYVPGTVYVNGNPMTPDVEMLDEFIFNHGTLIIPPGGTMEITFEATAVAEGNFTNAVYVEYICTCGQEGASDYTYAYVDGFIYFDVTPPTVTKTLIGPVCDSSGPVANPVVGRDWTLLATYNLPGSSPETWYNDLIDLSDYDGHQIQLGFRYLSDNEWAAYFDDILVTDGSTIAHFEDFDAYTDGYDFDGTAACGFYTQENYGTACGSTYHYAEVENYKSHSSPNSAEIYYNCPNDDWLITPEIDLAGLNGAYLDFWYLWDDSWDILFEVYVNDLGGGGPSITEYWITSETQICFEATDDNSGAEMLTIDVYYDMNNDGVINYTITDELQDQYLILDNIDPRDTNPVEGEITYCMTLPEECFHLILFYATDYEGNYPMNETTLEPIPNIEIDLVDNTPPLVNKTFSGPGTMDYLFLNEETLITLEATDLPEPPETEETLRGDTFYAYCAYGTYSYYTTWFDSDTPGTINPIAYDGYTYSFMAGGTWIDDTWWGSEYGGYGATYNRIWTIDETTGDMTLVGNTGLGTTTLNGLAYDDNTDTLYGCSSYGLYTVDMATGVATHVGDWGAGGPSGDIMIDMACDNDGNLYGIECGNSYDNALYSIDPGTGAASLIGYTGLDLYYAQGAEYDKNNDILYLAAYTYYLAEGEPGQPDQLAPSADPTRTGWFYICDTNTGATTLVGAFQGGSEMTALAIPYTGGGGGGGGGTGEIISPGCASGVVLLEYRVWYDGVWGPWTEYTEPFSLEEGCTHYLQYRAVDCLGNTLLCEDDIEDLRYEGGHMVDDKLDPSDGTPIKASDTGSGGSSVAPDREVDAWLRYDNDINNDALGLTAGGTMEWAIRLTPDELAGYDGWNLTTVQFHYAWSGGSGIQPHDVLITVYGAGTAAAPGSVITTEVITASTPDWYDVPLTTPVVIDETQDIWISCTCTHIAGEYPAGMNSGIGVTGKSSWINLGGWADYSSYLWCFNIAGGIEEGGATPPPPPPPPPPKNITVYNQTHYLDLEPPMSWIELELDHDGNMITPYTEFMIWQEDFACNQTYGSQCCFIHFRVDGPPGSMFYWNGEYFAADGSWHTGNEGFDTPIAFQIRDNTGYIKAGKYVVEYYAEDCLGNIESTIHHHTYFPDTTAPTTTLLFSGPHYEDQDEWINYNTEIKLDTDDLGSGAKLIKYRIDNDAWKTYEEPFHITTEGTHTISYYSKDWTNNAEDEKTKTVIVDSTAPQANLIFDGDTYDGETTTWITSDTHIQLPATDTGCGLKAIYYRVDNGGWTDYTEPFTLTTGTLIEFYTEDHLGNTAPIQQLTVGLDNEAPSITYIAPQENHLYIAGREILALRTESIIVGSLRVEATATDASGVEKIEFYIDGILRYMEPGNSLQWLWDEKSLFVHTLTIKAYDNLGRVSTKETKVNIFNL